MDPWVVFNLTCLRFPQTVISMTLHPVVKILFLIIKEVLMESATCDVLHNHSNQ